jgi:hypothetical protein
MHTPSSDLSNSVRRVETREVSAYVFGVAWWASVRRLGMIGIGFDLVLDPGFVALDVRVWTWILRAGANW